jgi:uroporphyrinogen decarboxylase
MTKREVVRMTLEADGIPKRRPPYVPWNIGLTVEAREKLQAWAERCCQRGVHLRHADLEDVLQNHFLGLGNAIGFFDRVDENRVRDVFGVVWDRSIDKDIGDVQGAVLPEPTLKGYQFPDPLDRRFFDDISERIARFGDRFRVFQIGFSLYERAWTMRGWDDLMMDFYDHPRFVRDLLNSIAEYNIAQVQQALKYDVDAIYFGDDWGMQRGLQMGPDIWHEYIYPVLKRMYKVVRDAGKYVMIHSCGDVDELFDDLIEIGLNCFNPFQPEVMDVDALLVRYRGRLSFYGGLSTQRTLPYGSVEDVRAETRHLLELGRGGGYIFSPAHDVEGDVPLENMLAFIEEVQAQPGYPG